MDRLTSLAVFGRVVEAGGFSAAARRLNMSVTSVSNHVQALEDRLGARLLNRTTRKVSLTEIGKAYYERTTQILAELDEADHLATALHATPRGTLRLYAVSAVVRFLTPIVEQYLTLYPAVSVDLTVGERVVDMLDDGYDLMIRTTPSPDSEFVVRSLTSWRHVLCCAPSYLRQHPPLQDLADVAHHNCLRYAHYPFGNEWRFQTADGAPASVRVRGNVVTSSAELLRRMVLDGFGLVLAPTFLIADDLRAGTLVSLLPAYRPLEFSINAIYPHRHQLSTKIRSFIDLLTEGFVAHRQWMSQTASDGLAPDPDRANDRQENVAAEPANL
jgi:DNA-binding transcriptional LysR family regulator